MVSRRDFLKTSLAGTAVAATPALLPSEALAQATPPHFITDAAGVKVLNPAFQPKFITPVPNAASAAFAHNTAGAANTYIIGVEQTAHETGLVAANGSKLSTTVWGYAGYGDPSTGPTFPGRTVFARGETPASGAFPGEAGTPISVEWRNNLLEVVNVNGVDQTQPRPSLLPIDSTLNIARSPATLLPGAETETFLNAYGIPLVVHQHGGNTPPEHDGGPDQWFTPTVQSQADSPAVGPGCVGGLATCNLPSQYPMAQEGGAAVWYHDHALGITRTNVYAGAAGFWITRDANEDALMAIPPSPGLPVIPSGDFEVAYAIQDRLFTAEGALYYPSDPVLYPAPDLTLPTPTHMPEMFGDTILVNGKAWPVQAVQPRPYRVRLLNGSDSRFYRLHLIPQATMRRIEALAAQAIRVPVLAISINAAIRSIVAAAEVQFWQIGTELGFLDKPVRLRNITFGPGERYDLVIDFSALNGATLVFYNDGATPFPDGDPTPIGSGADQIMAFKVNLTLDNTVPKPAPLTATTNLRPLHGLLPTIASLQAAAAPNPVRKIILAEGADHFGRIMPLLGAFKTETTGETILLDEEITETPAPGTTELWEFYNVSVDSHPLHMHLVDFRVLNRQTITANLTVKDHGPPTNVQGVAVDTVVLTGGTIAPAAYELGRKDTAICPPGQVTRVLVTFPERTGKYVYHCHILSHEDSEMMRFYEVKVPAAPAAA